MSLPSALTQTVSDVARLYGELPLRIDRCRASASDPSPPHRPNRPQPLSKVFQYTRLQTLLDSTLPWEWSDNSGTSHTMFGQHSVWATSAPYMNDRREYEHGREVLQASIDTRRNQNVLGEASVLTMLEGLLSEPLGPRFYVASFSEKSDDLGQWRGYGDWGQGICLGYNYLELEDTRPWLSGWVIYEPNTQRMVADMLVQDVINRISPNIVKAPTFEANIVTTAANLLRTILPAAVLLMKDPAFRDEAEYRLIQAEDAPGAPQIKYRTRGSRVVPYIEMTFADGKTLDPVSAPLEEVVLGPASNDRLNIEAVKGLLSSRGLTSISVNPSPIPFLP